MGQRITSGECFLEQVMMMAVTAIHFSIFPSDPLQNPVTKAGQPLMLPPLPVKQ